MKKDIFDYRDYKQYVRDVLDAKPNEGRGTRIALARGVGSPVSHISQVLNGHSDFSMEQAEGVNQFFGHTQDEAQFFLLLLQLSRAGTAPLRKRLGEQLEQFLERRFSLSERLGVKAGISLEDQSVYYSSWLYGAAHVLISIEQFQTKEALSLQLGISLKRTAEILEFLISVGLAKKKEKGRFEIGTARIHLGADSPMISRFHANWRVQAIRAMDRDDFKNSPHYSSAVTLSNDDFTRIKSLLVNCIQQVKAIVKESKEEGAHCFAIDFFKI